MPPRRRRRSEGPLTAAGLVRFFEDVEAKVKISPIMVIIVGIAISVMAAVLNIIFK
ncbi:MAG: preprotein translocase subunit Sec61beta [Desulfurococcales archaeon ex4484_204]|nr:MAG: preprotein translocase subunit Sec61beta [Desulfurococcales archaeon ex4484_204]RLG81373.1 MAG: preprotein translocase subunit Sec61beta [Thermoprotei archaeon]